MSDFIPKAGGVKVGGLSRKAQRLQAMREKAADVKTDAKPAPGASTAAVGYRLPAWVWRAGELLRSRQSFGLSCGAVYRVWDLEYYVWLSLRRVQLDICDVPASGGSAAGPIWCAARGAHQHAAVEHGVVWCGGDA